MYSYINIEYNDLIKMTKDREMWRSMTTNARKVHGI
jgi:hypothetical protein